MLALSSSILPPETRSIDETVSRLLDPGIGAVILGAQIDGGTLPGVCREIVASGTPIVALRCPCPGPRRPRPDEPSLFASDSQERESAIEEALATLQYAARCEAPIVVISAAVLAVPDCGPRLRQLSGLGEEDGEEARLLRERLETTIQEVIGSAWDALCFSLERLIVSCLRLEIELALTNPGLPHGFPRQEEWPRLSTEFSGAPLARWFDPVASVLRQQIGLEEKPCGDSEEAVQILGCDVKDLGKNGEVVAAGDGEIDLVAALSQVPSEALRSLELPQGCPMSEIKRACDYLRGAHLDGDPPSPPCDPFPIIGSPPEE